jgi:DNA-binding MarR family transcriptional regulator
LVNYCLVETRPQLEQALSAVEVISRLAGLFAVRRRQLAERAGLTVQQWQALESVQREHFMPSLFAAERDSSPAAVSKILRQLSDKGLIEAELSRVDGRQRNYSVTPAGRLCLDGLRAERQRAIEHVWMQLSEQELEQFEAVGSKLALLLEQFAEEDSRSERQAR